MRNILRLNGLFAWCNQFYFSIASNCVYTYSVLSKNDILFWNQYILPSRTFTTSCICRSVVIFYNCCADVLFSLTESSTFQGVIDWLCSFCFYIAINSTSYILSRGAFKNLWCVFPFVHTFHFLFEFQKQSLWKVFTPAALHSQAALCPYHWDGALRFILVTALSLAAFSACSLDL